MDKNLKNLIDVKETKIPKKVLEVLLKDRTTGNNILWLTDSYKGHKPLDEIFYEDITGEFEGIIMPRRCKSKIEQQKRTKDKAEVFTPSWVCCIQNNYPDEQRFGKDVFAKVDYNKKTWETITDPIPFPMKDGGSWQDYVKANVLEATCGEAPYIISRYDSVDGNYISIENRIGLLDRKFRVINEARKGWHKTKDEEKITWLKWSKEAIKHTYGYEWQGDSLLIARENVYKSFLDYYRDQFDEEPDMKDQLEVADIISWNLWQMDGLKFVIPMSCEEPTKKSKSYSQRIQEHIDKVKEFISCPGCKEDMITALRKTKVLKKSDSNYGYLGHIGIPCIIKNWDTNTEFFFGNCLETEKPKIGKLFDKLIR